MSIKKVIVGDGTAQELAALEARAAHEAAAVAEGRCPVHDLPMQPVDLGDTMIAGRCGSCERYWWYDTSQQRIGEMQDHDPVTGEWISPWQAGERQ